MSFKPPAGPLCSPDQSLVFDEACLHVTNTLGDLASLFSTYTNCHKCKLTFWANVPSYGSMSLIVRTQSPLRFMYTYERNKGMKSCVEEYHFGQHGVYKYVMDLSCDGVEIVTPPGSSSTSMYLFLLLILLLWVAYIVFDKENIRKMVCAIIPRKMRRKCKKDGEDKDNVEEHELTEPVSDKETSTKILYDEHTDVLTSIEFISRGTNTDNTQTELEGNTLENSAVSLPEFDFLLSLRGLVVTTYTFSLIEGGSYLLFRKSLWNGFKIVDVFYGALYWVLAASIYIRVRNSLVNGEKKIAVFLRQVLLRSLSYVVGGILYNKINETSPPKFPFFSLRVLGVFQRIGVSSLIIFSLEVCLMKVHIKKGPFFQDIIDCWPQLTVATLLAAAHTCVTYLLPVPGCPTGYTGAGGLADYGEAEYCTGGAAGYIDRSIFPRTFLIPIDFWESTDNAQTYGIEVPFDPECLLGTLNTCFLMALAIHTTRVFIYFKNPLGRTMRLLFSSCLQGLIGIMLSGLSDNEGLVPPNVYLMSLSYVFLVSGMCSLIFLCFYLLIDVCKIWTGLPLIYTGANIIVVYVGVKLLRGTFPFECELYGREDVTVNTLNLLKALGSVGVWTAVCYYLYQKNIICPV